MQYGLKGRTSCTRAARAAWFEGHTLRNDETRLEKSTRGRNPGSGTWRMRGIPLSQKGKTHPKSVTLKRGRKIDEEWLPEGIRPKAAGKRH